MASKKTSKSFKSNSSDSYQTQKNPSKKISRGLEIEFEAKTENQKKLLQEFEDKDIVFAIGKAGTGKTYLSIAWALKQLFLGNYSRIVLTKSVQPAVDQAIGYLPGSIFEKLEPVMESLMDIIYEFIPDDYMIEELMGRGDIEIKSLAYLRGLTFKNDVILICDESQNMTQAAMKLLLTRFGENNVKFIITGDTSQSDLSADAINGLVDIIKRVKGEPEFGLVEFTSEDVVRSGLARKIIELYEKDI